MNIPELLINFRGYDANAGMMSVSDIELSKMSAMTQTIKGGGVVGEMDMPVLGTYQDMEMKFTYRAVTAEALKLSKHKSHQVDIRGSIQVQDNQTGDIATEPVKIVARGLPKEIELGKMEVGGTMDVTVTLSVYYIKVDVNKKTYIEVDKFNYKSITDGEDALASVRSDLGL